MIRSDASAPHGTSSARDKLLARRRAGPKRRSPRDGVQSAIWTTIVGWHRRAWTCPDLARASGAALGTVHHYVRALVRAGLLVRVEGPVLTQAGALPATYRTRRKPGPLAPLVRGTGGARIAYDPNGARAR